MKGALAALLLALAGCVTLSTANMTEHCREDYNHCLNGCRGPVNHDTQTPSCTEQCNQTAKFCR